MSDPSSMSLLIVDHAQSDIDHVAQTLRGDGYQVDLTATAEMETIRSAIYYQPLDMVLLRCAEGLPTVVDICAIVSEAEQDMPVIAVVDEAYRENRKVSRLLEEGADNFFYLEDADHLMATVRKELRHLRLRRAEHSLEVRTRESDTRTQALLEGMRDALAYIHEGVHVYANPAYLRLFGYTNREELTAIQLIYMVPPGYRDALKSVLRRCIRSGKAVEAIELVGVRSDGQSFPILLECAPTRMNDEPCTQIVVRDATPQKSAYTQQLEAVVQHDEITKLYTRRFFLENVDLNHNGAVLYILLTDYASIRCASGFESIDQFMLEVGQIVKSLIGPEDFAGAFATGVITVFVHPNSPEDPIVLAERVRMTITEHSFRIQGKLFTTTCCIGVYRSHDSQENALQMVAHADRACETARTKGGKQIEVFVPPTPQEQRSRPLLNEQDESSILLLRDALKIKGRLSLSYQPIVSFEHAQEARYKAYLNILDEANQPQPLDKLGPVAVRYGLMGAFDKWAVIHILKAQMTLWQTGIQPSVFTRLSLNSMHQQDFPTWLSKQITDSQLPAGALVFEIKEENADEYFEETGRLRAFLRELGCGFALSHFGGKAHSERLLRELLPDYVKLDGSVIERLAKAKDEEGRRAMAELSQHAHELNAQVVAAGVSTAPQMASIWQFGVTLVQGNMVAESTPHLDFDFKQYAN